MDAYRDPKEPLRSRRDVLFARLNAIELDESAEATTLRTALVRELEEVGLDLRARDEKRLPILDAIQIRTPCPAKWEAMVGTDRVRHCGTCEKEVWNLTALDADEIQAFLAERGATKPCVRIFRRADQHFMAEACSAGRVQLVRAASVAAVFGLAAASALLAPPAPAACARRLAPDTTTESHAFMGEMAAPPARAVVHDGAWPPPARIPLGFGHDAPPPPPGGGIFGS